MISYIYFSLAILLNSHIIRSTSFSAKPYDLGGGNHLFSIMYNFASTFSTAMAPNSVCCLTSLAIDNGIKKWN